MAGANIVFGGGSFGFGGELSVKENAEEVLDVLEQEGVKDIDTAQAYGMSDSLCAISHIAFLASAMSTKQTISATMSHPPAPTLLVNTDLGT